jgi:hydroxymethylglutaryl-CoA synthase
MNNTVGIDDIAFYVPRTFIEFVKEKGEKYFETEFSKKRGFETSYLGNGLGTVQGGLPDGQEDSVTMGAMAFKKLIDKNNLQLSDIGRIYVGTESPVDHSKPNAVYIKGAIEKSMGIKDGMMECTPLDLKFACAGGTAGLELASEWVELGKNKGKIAVVIASDVSSYDLKSNEEVTQGAGAVAMLVKDNPRLLALENGMTADIMSTISQDRRDFFRPANRHTAVVDGPLSVECYIDTCKKAFLKYSQNALKKGIIKEGELLTDKIDRILLHLPFQKMAEKATAPLYIRERRNTPIWKEIIGQIGPEPSKENKKETEVFRKKVRSTKQFTDFFENKMKSGTIAAKRTGNAYTASLYNSLGSMIETDLSKGIDLCDNRIAFGSYGSGCMFKAFTGIFQPEYKKVASGVDLLRQLDDREKNTKGFLSLEDYERLHEKDLKIETTVLEPKNQFVLSSTDKDGYRQYDFVN